MPRRDYSELSPEEQKELELRATTMVALFGRLPKVYRRREQADALLIKLRRSLTDLREEYMAIHKALRSNRRLRLKLDDDPVAIIEQMRELLSKIKYEDSWFKTADFAPTRGRPRGALVRWMVELTSNFGLSMKSTREFMTRLKFKDDDITPKAIRYHAARLRREGKKIEEFPRGRPRKTKHI